jgi:hypothetical protein
VSFFQDKWCTGNYHDFDEWNKPLPWQMLGFILESYSQQSFASKEDAPLYCPTVFNKLKQCKKNGEPYDGWRNELNATVSAMVPLDLDDDFAFEFVAQFLTVNRIEAVLYTTASHRLAEPRLRLLIPLAGEVDPAMHTMAANSIVAVLKPGAKLKDTSKSTANSMFYVPGRYASAEENPFIHIEGHVLTAAEWFELGGLSLDEVQAPAPVAPSVELSSDVVWSYEEPLERYLALGKGGGRHVAFCGFVTSVAMKAMHAGYDLSVGELADIAQEVHRANPPSKPYKDFDRLAHDAMGYTQSHVDVPAHVLRAEAWERKTIEVEQMLDGSFWEPRWPASWIAEAQETIAEIRQLHPPAVALGLCEHPPCGRVGGEAAAPEGLVAPVIEPVAEFEVDEDELADPPTDEVVHEPVAADEPANFFGSLVPPPQLTAGLLPDKLGDFVFDEADRMGADPAGLALAVIIIAATAVSNVVRIAPMQKNDGWEEPPLLWGLLAGDPGSKKSPIMNAAMSPLLTAEMEWRKSDAYKMEQYHEELEDYQDKSGRGARPNTTARMTAPWRSRSSRRSGGSCPTILRWRRSLISSRKTRVASCCNRMKSWRSSAGLIRIAPMAPRRTGRPRWRCLMLSRALMTARRRPTNRSSCQCGAAASLAASNPIC